MFLSPLQDRNRNTVVKIQGWLPLNEIRRHVREDDLILPIKSTFVSFLAECYANVERPAEPQVANEIWRVIEQALPEVTRFVSFFLQTATLDFYWLSDFDGV